MYSACRTLKYLEKLSCTKTSFALERLSVELQVAKIHS